MGLGEISLGEMGLGEMGLGEMGQNPIYYGKLVRNRKPVITITL